jgi:hypothetical protein
MSAWRLRPTIGRANLVIAALLGLVTGTVALVFQLAPGLQPDPRDRVGADVSVFALEPNVTIGAWIKRGFPTHEQVALMKTYQDRAAVGEMLYVRTTVDGHKHREANLRFDVFNAETQQPIPRENIDAPPIEPLAISSPSERSVRLVWVPDLTQDERDLFFRVELWDDSGMLAVTDSPVVRRGRFATPKVAK